MEPADLEIKTLSSGFIHVRGKGPCNWAQGATISELEPFEEAGAEFRADLLRLKRGELIEV